MEDTTFTEGDLVRLKSGGPLMTYAGEAFGGDALCKWFDKTETKSAAFGYAMLEKSKKEKPS